MLRGHRTKLSLAVAFLCFLPAPSIAQTGTAYSLDDITEFVKGGLTSASILSRARNSCINFRVTQSASDRLRAAGADKDLLAGLRSVCNKSDSKSGGDSDRTTTRDVQKVVPRPPKRDPVKPVRKVITPDDQPTVQPTVYTPPIVSPTNNGSIDWDFRSDRPVTPGHYNNCNYEYSPSGYTITVLEYGGSCLDGSTQEWEPNIRVSTRATPVSGAPGFTYGLRFGISDDSTVGYYAFEVSSYGHFELSRYRNNKWEVVFPWQTGTGINANATNTITADIHGATVKFTINGIEQYTYRAPMPIRGRAGFGIIGFDKTGPFPVVTFQSFNVSGEKSVGNPTVTTNPVTPATAGVDYDFRVSQPLSAGRYGKCQYDYSSSGYTVSVAEFGSTCIDGPVGDQPANVRVSTTALGLRGTTGYTYGLRLGYTSDSTVGYYAFEVSEGGSFQLSRYRMNRWEPLIPWQRLSVINPASSGIPNILTAEIRGTSLTLYVNNSQVGTYQTPYPVVGPAGFGIIGYEQSGVPPAVTFSRFSIAPLSGGSSTTTTTTNSTALVDYDFLSSRPLSTGLYGHCQYDYSSQGYIITLADTAGYICIDGPSAAQPTNVRISATGLPLRAGTGYMYGVRFGHKTEPSLSYYLYELNESGEVKLSQYNGQWVTLLPWRSVSNAHSAGSGIPNVMAVDVRGSSVTLYLNGSPVGSYQASEQISGRAGFGITGFTTGAPSIAYTRFTVTPIY